MITETIRYSASPQQLYEALTDSQSFSRMTGGAPTDIGRKAGENFSCFGGMIHGMNVETVPGERLVQAWRAKNWGDGLYSIVRFQFQAEGKQTILEFSHTGYPQDEEAHLIKGWKDNYWDNLEKMFGSS